MISFDEERYRNMLSYLPDENLGIDEPMHDCGVLRA